MTEHVLSYHGSQSPTQAREALVTVAIETALLVTGEGIHKRISDLLMSLYGCRIIDCYKHPKYLSAVLSMLGNETKYKITNKIRKELEEYSYIKSVCSFLVDLEN